MDLVILDYIDFFVKKSFVYRRLKIFKIKSLNIKSFFVIWKISLCKKNYKIKIVLKV